MARPRCNRHIGNSPTASCFGPKCLDSVDENSLTLALEELEAIRLCDLHKMHQQQAAEEMNVSRQTLGRIIESAHEKLAKALTEGLTLIIDGGDYIMSNTRTFCCTSCSHRWELPFGGGRPTECPSCKGNSLHRDHSDLTAVATGQEQSQGPGNRCCKRQRKGGGGHGFHGGRS